MMLAAFIGLIAVVSAQNASYVVDLGYAQYAGVLNQSVVQYFGIRYAQPPLGELRWRAPLDIEAHGGYDPSVVMPATERGPICVQGTPYWRPNPALNGTGSEDCLLLDVLVPPNPVSDYLPVLVQIHGGGYDQGNSESNPGYLLVNQSRGSIIYVSIQYRLDAFGFLSSSEIKENGVANAGLLDQRAALGWVQRNIRAFGGDPSQVTIIGGSAGGGSVMDQMILYGGVSNPPFRAAIAEYPWWQSYKNNTILEAQYREILTATNCSTLACLRNQSTATIVSGMQSSLDVGYLTNVYGYGDFYYGPAVDGYVIRDLPSNEFKRGHFTKVPLLTNRDGYEGYNYSPKNETTQDQETLDLQIIFPYAKQSFFKRLYQLYPADAFNSTLFQRQSIYGDYIIDCPTYYMATATSDWGQPTWKMIFNAGSQLHGADGPFLWGPQSGVNNVTLANIMKDWYLGFIINLDPNTIAYSNTPKPYWPQYQTPSGSNFSVMDVNYTMMGVIPDMDANARCDFFHGQSYVVRN
ncbi:hypothetical protein BAUCODRAFT_32113 [Baudoinia panamericana UAMH 10762]|uniref:Carboxylic ester hydrolase n=1 Tax=Baudoinia panamericana (strain UAMH 10762) TaxID=717646 RepID=M2LU86_BAUPA|nr:uncharacterized protein BAUCODRAFT_32113 [Baudoinia panamericana UAMH 10762]EMC98112.1 hypothetical protein BAUCODRAFT_32113 [Baudoinia panamericana UAMH 10762]